MIDIIVKSMIKKIKKIFNNKKKILIIYQKFNK